MKRIFLLAVMVLAACAHPDPNTPEQIEANLKEAMTKYLYDFAKSKNDTAKVSYDIEEVIYYPEKTTYLCEFKVRMKSIKNYDTTGYMKAYITKDFKKVDRFY